MSDYRQFGEPVAHPIHMRIAFSKGFDTGHWIGGVGKDATALDEISRLADLVTGKHTEAADTAEQQDLITPLG